MAKQKRRIYCKFCDYFCYTPEDYVSHLEKHHDEMIPEDMTPWQFSYYLRTGKSKGSCIMCKKDTEWNEKTHKYNRFCKNPKCKEKYRDIFKDRMIGKYGKTHLLNDPEQQKKMLANRKISGEYTWRDHITKTTYTGSYEKNFLMFLDEIMNFDPSDIMAPSPHTYFYEYEGEKHFYIPDFFIPSLDLEIEIKDGGDNANMHPKIQAVDKVKEKLKDDVMLKNHFNYIKVTNQNHEKFFEYLNKAKEQFYDKIERPIYMLESELSLDDLNVLYTESGGGNYEPPYTLEQIKKNYSEEVYNNIKNDPIHKWRAENGIELIHKEPSKEELERIMKNWDRMSAKQKQISDQKSIELFGCTNKENYDKLIKTYTESTDTVDDNVREVYDKYNKLNYGIPNHSTSEKDFRENYRYQSPRQLMSNNKGVCWDYSSAISDELNNLKIDTDIYYFELDGEQSHTVTISKINNKYVCLDIHNRIHTSENIEEIYQIILNDVCKQRNRDLKKSGVYDYTISKFKNYKNYGCSMEEYMDFAHSKIFKKGKVSYSKNLKDVFNESVDLFEETHWDTLLTRPEVFLNKAFKVYHYSNCKKDEVIPITVNAGNKLAKPRFSSWWTPFRNQSGWALMCTLFSKFPANKWKELTWTQEAFDESKVQSKIPVGVIGESFFEKNKDVITSIVVYEHEKTFKGKDLGRGNEYSVDEFTCDFPVKPDNVRKVTWDEIKNFVKIVPDEDLPKYAKALNNMRLDGKNLQDMVHDKKPWLYWEFETTTEIRNKYCKDHGIDFKIDEEYFRFTHKGVGVYQALKEAVTPETWSRLIKSSAFTWLPKPDEYPSNHLSYFTNKGRDEFLKKVLPICKKYLGEDIEYSKVKNLTGIVYKDQYQVIVKYNDYKK